MNFKNVEKWIDEIKEFDVNGDVEKAHINEDLLLWAFVEHISNPDNTDFANNNALANLILSELSDDYDVDRYYA